MRKSSLLAGTGALPDPQGHDTAAWVPSDRSDGGGSMGGLHDAQGADAVVEGPGIGVDRVFLPNAAGEGMDPPDDEDPDLAFIDDLQAEGLPPHDQEQAEPTADPADRVDASGRPIPAVLWRQR